MKKVVVRYSVKFETVMYLDDDMCEDEYPIEDIDIPENTENKYVPDSFEVLSKQVVS